MEEFHREAKQLRGIEECQCRSGRIRGKHKGCALLELWTRLKRASGLPDRAEYLSDRAWPTLHEYLVEQLEAPSVEMVLA